MSRYGCPKGHTEGIEESFRMHLWLPVNTETGETNREAEGDMDWEGLERDCYYFCPTCNDTFDKLIEHESQPHSERS